MTLSSVNAGHVAGQAVLIADQRRKNGSDTVFITSLKGNLI